MRASSRRSTPWSCTIVAVLSLVTGCHAMPEPTSKPQILPLRTLHLYETGVGYFERSGEVGGASAMALPVPAGHLDDALKTLVVLGPAGKTFVRGLEFGSSVSKGMARAQAGLPLEADTPITFRDLLTSLKGARVEIAIGTETIAGRIIDVVDEKPDGGTPDSKEAETTDDKAKKDKSEPSMVLLLLTDKGEIRRVKAIAMTAVRPVDATYVERLGSSLDALSTRSAATPRALELLGTAKGPVTFGYVAETPIWRSSYRLVLDPDQKGGVMQGWALLHNDTDEAWKGVKVSLVNGRPDSFLFPLAAPRYARRALVTPDGAASTVPQLLDTTADAIWGDHLDSVGTIGHGSGVGYGSGYGSAYGHATKSPKMMMGEVSVGVAEGSSSLLSVGNLAGVASAEGVESGALFAYSLSSSLDLGAHKSALVPFLSERLDVEAITWIDRKDPRAAVRLSNSTKQTIPSGTVSFFGAVSASGGGSFVGESAIDRLKPGERRFIDFGADLDVDLVRMTKNVKDESKRLRFSGDYLEENYLRTTDETWDLGNRSGLPRTVYVVLHLDKNASIKGADGQDYDLANRKPLAYVRIGAKSKLTRDFTSVEGLRRSVPFSMIDTILLTALSTAMGLPANERGVIVEALAKSKELDDTRTELSKNRAETKQVEGDLERFREHLKAMGDKGPAPAANPFVQKILQHEEKLVALRKKRAALEKDETTHKDALRVVLKKLPS